MVVVVDSLDEVAVMKDCPTCLKTFVSPLMNQAVLASLNLMAFVPFARSSITPAEEELINCLKRPWYELRKQRHSENIFFFLCLVSI